MESIVEKAKNIATKAHEGQVYGAGRAYIIHPTEVAQLAERLGYPEEVVAAGYLHDVVEDTPITLDELRKDFPAVVIDAVAAVTYMDEDHDAKIRQAMSHPLGHVVKFCDASCNFANSILHGPKPGQILTEVVPRRAAYLAKLLSGLPSPEAINRFIAENTRSGY